MRIKPHHKVALIYLVLGSLWIFFSDTSVELLFQDKASITFAQHVKGWFFIGFTGILLFFLVRKDVTDIQHVNERLLESYEQTISGWVRVMDLRHKETKDHTQRVMRMTVALARQYGLTDEETLRRIGHGALLHDIGKIGIPDSILIKPGKLSEDEWAQMQLHPQIGHDILANIDYLSPCKDIPWCHHEKWDGSGYPRGLAGEDIPLAARLFAVVDVWDALIHPRIYKQAWPESEVLAHIQSQAGVHFDPVVVETFLRHYDAIKASADQR